MSLLTIKSQDVWKWNKWNEVIDELALYVTVGDFSQVFGRSRMAILGVLLKEFENDLAEEYEFKEDHHLE